MISILRGCVLVLLCVQIAFITPVWPQTERSHVRIGYSAADMSFAPIWLAQDQNFFEKVGLESELLYVRGGPILIESLIAGEIQAAGVGGTPVVLSSAAGATVKMVLSFNNILPYEVFASPKEGGRIRSIADLKGKRVGVSRRGAESEGIIRLLLKKAKINPRDVTFLQIGGSGERLAALQKGAIDATAMSLPLNLVARQRGFPMIATVMKDNMDWLHTGLAMNQPFIDKNKDTAQRIVSAVIEATDFGLKNEEVTKRVIGKYLKVEDENILRGAYGYFKEFYVKDFRPSKDSIQQILDELSTNRPEIRQVRPENVTNLSLLAAAGKEIRQPSR